MRILFFMIAISFAVSAKSQSKLRLAVGGEAGLTRGGTDKSSYFLVNYGVRFSHTTIAMGGGLDGYRFRSVPFYLIAKQELGHRAVRPFVDFSAGVNFSNPNDEQRLIYGRNQNAEFSNGFYLKSSAGVSFRICHSFRTYLSAGYSYKTMQIVYGKYSVYPGVPPNQYTDIFRMNRWCFSTGFWF